jgi:addiction module RelE/StbE family toxin
VNNVIISEAAIADLNEIKQYITVELGSPSAANRLVANIMKAIRKLNEYPEVGSKLSSIINIETNYRYLVCENYLVFYRTENLNIFVDRILYGRRDYIKILFE